MHFRFGMFFAGLAPLAATAAALASPARPFRFDELAAVRRVGGFSVSRDGQWVAFAVGTPDVEENRTRSAVWIQSVSGGEPRRLTSGEKRDSDPKFSPDGRKLAFLSNRDGTSQIWVLDLAGGEPAKATAFPMDIDSYSWSPDGGSFVLTADVFPDCADTACNERRSKEREKSRTKARVAERLLFRHWDSWKEGLRTHVWKIPVAAPSSAAVDLTPGDRDAPPFSIGGGDDYDVSPDGRDLVYASNPDKVEALSTNGDIWTVSFEGKGRPTDWTSANKAYDGRPKFSPDGKWIAYLSQKRPGFESDRFTLMLLDRATGRIRGLTENYDGWVESLAWASDSRSIYFVTHVGSRGAIFRVGLEGKPEEIWRGGSASGLTVSRDNRLFFSFSSLSRAAEIWSAGADGKGAAPVTHVNDGLFRDVEMGEVSERITRSADGRNLQAWVVKPPAFDSSRKYPAVLLIHGGPQGAWTDGWSFRWNPQVWAAYGYVVYAPNPRGSTGFGQKFVDEISGDWGGKVYDDLMRQADDLESLPFVDRARIGAAGASYGGYMIDWIAGHSRRFKALVSHDGTFDTVSSNLETEELWFPTWEFKGWPWEPGSVYQKWNPMLFAGNFQTPTLVITSERDYRVPFGQGLQFFTALQVRGVPSKLLTFPDEGHWVLKPGNSRLWHATVMDWLHRYLGGAAPDPKALETAYSVTK